MSQFQFSSQFNYVGENFQFVLGLQYFSTKNFFLKQFKNKKFKLIFL